MDNLNKNTNQINKIQDSLSQIIQNTSVQRKIPPLQNWQPCAISELNITITDKGEWWHDGTKMTRQSLIDLFASVLWAEYDADGRKHYFLKTPSDKYQIHVVDVPLFINTVDNVVVDGVSWLVFGTTNQDRLCLTDESPLYFGEFVKDGTTQERLYMDTRFHLTACVLPAVLYQLAELGNLYTKDGQTMLDVQSGGKTYTLVSHSVSDNW